MLPFFQDTALYTNILFVLLQVYKIWVFSLNRGTKTKFRTNK